MIKELIPKRIKTSYRLVKYSCNRYLRKRMPFSHNQVVGGVSGLPEFSARIYNEVKLFQKAIGNYRSTRSLEIGCGYGRLTPWIADHSNEHFAVDPESRLLQDTRKLYPNVHLHQSKAQNLPFSDNYFDLCVSWTVLQHIPPEELPKACKEIKRVLKSNAIIILAEETRKKHPVTRQTTWARSPKEWENLFTPWKLMWKTKRKLEEPFEGHEGYAGMVMRFKIPSK